MIPLNSALAKKKPPENYAELNFVVLRDEDGKPVRNAAISLHRIDTNGNQTHEGMELKADADGKAAYAGVPYGVLRVQVIAAGFQTWGQDFIINQPERTFTIRLKPPAKQHSIYE